MSEKKNYQFLHSTYWCSKDHSEDAVVATLKDVDTHEVKLKIFKNPKRSIGITKKGLQETHDSKKLCEDVNNLDVYTIQNSKLREELQRLINGHPMGYASLKSLLNNPYVYGADIPIEVLMKQHFFNTTSGSCSTFRVGGLDIETSVTGGHEILMITYVSPEFKVYTGVLKSFIKTTSIPEINTYADSVFSDLKSKLNKDSKTILDKYFNTEIPGGIELHVTEHLREVDLIKWVFSKIHEDKPEFISIWNMGYDIPYILDRLYVFNVNPENILCHPDVPHKYRTCVYKKDTNKKLQHFTFRWDMFNLSGYSQFYDSMCLYSRLRKHEGMKDSYSLQAIAEEVLGTGKLTHDNDNHFTMQTTRQKEYVVYNMIDSILITLLEKRLKDISSMMMLIKDTDIGSFAQQTVQLRNWFYNYCRQHNKIPASWQGKILHNTDELIENVGGNVLAPGLAWRTGINKIKELMNTVPDAISKLVILASDVDVTAMYPSIMAACNVDKETKKLTVLGIDGLSNKNIVDIIGHLTTPSENANYICSKYFNLPSYKQMEEMFDLKNNI